MARKRNKTLRNRLMLAVLVFVAAAVYVTVVYYRAELEQEEARRIRYEAFGIDIPEGYKIHGIDVSNYQGYIDFPSVKAMQIDTIRIGFVFMKATEGTDFKDKRFERNWKHAKQAGMIRGAYHFFLPTRSGKKQAEFFMKQTDFENGDLIPVVDIENLYGVKPEVMRRELKIFLNTIEQQFGVKPVIYSYLHFYEKYLSAEFDEYPLWIAHYLQPDKPRISRSFSFWQHSESGRVNGIKTKVDFNVYNGDSASFNNLLIK